MASSTFDKTFTYEIEFDETNGEVIGVGGSSKICLCEWVQKHIRAGDGEIQVNTNIKYTSDPGCTGGCPDNWEEPYYEDERTIESVTVGKGKEEQILPFQTAGEGVRAEIQRLVYDEDVDPPADDDPRERD
jgi:hypothetical protein